MFGTSGSVEEPTGAAAAAAAGGEDAGRTVGGRPTSQRAGRGTESAEAAAEEHRAGGLHQESDGSGRAAETTAQGTERGGGHTHGLHIFFMLTLNCNQARLVHVNHCALSAFKFAPNL